MEYLQGAMIGGKKAMQGDMSVLWNAESQNHVLLINRLLKSTKRFGCVVAFAKWSGLKPIHSTLVERLKDGMTARFIIGLDFCQSEPKLLDQLLTLRRKYGVDVLDYRALNSVPLKPRGFAKGLLA